MENLDNHANTLDQIPGQKKKLNELNNIETNILQSKLAILLFNYEAERQKPKGDTISSTEKAEWSEKDKGLFREAFYKWTDESNATHPSLSFREYISRTDGEREIDINDPEDVKNFFETVFKNPMEALQTMVVEDLI